MTLPLDHCIRVSLDDAERTGSRSLRPDLQYPVQWRPVVRMTFSREAYVYGVSHDAARSRRERRTNDERRATSKKSRRRAGMAGRCCSMGMLLGKDEWTRR